MKHTFVLLFILIGLLLRMHPAMASDLAYYLPPHTTQWVEPVNTDTRPFLLLTQESEYALENGKVLMVPEWGLTPLQSPFMRALHTQLPHYGWHSIAFSTPNIDAHRFFAPHVGGSNYPNDATEEPLIELTSPLQQRMQDTLAHFSAEPGMRIVVAEGLSAGVLIQLFHQGLLPPPDAFIVVSPYLPQWQLNQELAKSLAALPFPVLDLQAANANNWSSSTTKNRAIQAKRAHHFHYRQRTMPRSPILEQVLTKHIYGWLKHEGLQG